MKTRRITELGILLAVSLILSYLESLLPVMIAVPGIKLGLANIITMLILYCYNVKNAFFFMMLRIVLSGFLFSNVSGMLYSLAGGMLCVIGMGIIKKMPAFSILGVSMSGAVLHNVGQIIVAFILMENMNVFYYIPVLFVSGAITGICIGYLTSILIKHYNRFFIGN